MFLQVAVNKEGREGGGVSSLGPVWVGSVKGVPWTELRGTPFPDRTRGYPSWAGSRFDLLRCWRYIFCGQAGGLSCHVLLIT